MDRPVPPGHMTGAVTGRCLARAWRRLPVGLTVSVATFWLLVAGAVTSMLPARAASAPKAGFVAVSGRTAHIHQPEMPDWPIAVDRRAYDEYHRGFWESDEEAIEHAFAAFEWISVFDGQAIRVLEVDGEAHRVELLEGRDVGRRGWLKVRHLRP